MHVPANSTVRFADFELDLSTGELRSNGNKTYLQEKPFQILSLLVEQPGQLVTREQLMKQLWPDGTFVDFDQSLNKAVNRLREALGDSADQPKFIETLPRRGYRFIAKVEGLTKPDGTPESLALSDEPAVKAQKTLAQQVTGTLPRHPVAASFRARWAKRILAGAVAAAVFVVAWIVVSLPSRSLPLAPSDMVLVSDFVNTTGDPVFDGTLKQALTVKLAESPYFNILPYSKVSETLSLMGRPSSDHVVPPLAREVCQRAGAKVAVSGSIIAIGGQYMIDLRAINCLTGTGIAHEESEAPDRDRVLGTLGVIIPRLRKKLGESVGSIQKFDTPIEQATTKSLAALKAFATGDEQRNGQHGGGSGETFYKMAIDLDPDFAMAYARMGVVYANIGNSSLADEYFTKAFQRRTRVSEREKLYIASHYYSDYTRELDKAIEILRLLTETYPNDWGAFNNLSSYATRAGRLDEAISAGQQALRLNPTNLFPYMSLAIAYFRASRFAEAGAICEQAVKSKRDGGDLHAVLLSLAYVNGDDAAVQRELELFTANHDPGFRGIEAQMAFALGQVRKGREIFQGSRDIHLRPQDVPENNRNAVASGLSAEAYLELEVGNLQQARAKAETALNLMPESAETQSNAAVVFAALGDFILAQQLTKKLKERFPADTMLNTVTIPTVQAIIEMKKKNYSVAIDALTASTSYDFGVPAGGAEGSMIYQRGLAYLASGSGHQAAVQFQKLIDNRGVVGTSVLWPLAHLGLARAYAQDAQAAKGTEAEAARAHAKTAYQEFFSLWKDADPDIPILKKAKAEYAKLQ